MPRGKARRTVELIDASRAILEDIQPASVRAVCYRLFAAGLLDSMKKTETNRVSVQLTWAREQGWIPWDWIVDETRAPELVPTWDSPESLLRAAAHQYRKDRWALQPRRVEVWSEKGTVRGTLRPVLDTYGITFRVMHGYGSATAVHEIAEESQHEARPFVAYYVGDYDPSGLHMSAVDLPARLDAYGADVRLVRLALIESDTTDGLPWFDVETKRGDTRSAWFRARYGTRCWELDALAPPTLRARVADAIEAEIADPGAWARGARAEAEERESLMAVVGQWRRTISGQATE